MTEPREPATQRRISNLARIGLMFNETGDEETNLAERPNFIRKVYFFLIIKLSVIVPIIFFVLYNQDIQQFFQKNFLTVILFGVLFAVSILTLVYYTASKEYIKPAFEYAMETLILFEASYLSVAYVSNVECDREEVLLAIMTSMLCCLGLTIYAFRTKYDFTLVYATQYVWRNHSKSIKIILAIHGVTFLCTLVLLIVYRKFIIQIFNIWWTVTLTPLVLMSFILDAQLIGGKHKLVYSPQKAVLAGFQLFWSFILINLFMIDFMKYFGGFRE